MSEPKYITEFLDAIYPEYNAVARMINNEKSVLMDATNLIKELRAELIEKDHALKDAVEMLEKYGVTDE